MPGLKTGMDFTGQVWKQVWKMTLFGLKKGQDLENRAAQPHQEFPGVPPLPVRKYEQGPRVNRVLAIIPRAGLKFFCVFDLPLPKTTKISFFCEI